jgi:hypothetical protein
MTFPSVTAQNLERQMYHLPRDFEGVYNVVLLAFTQEQQYDVDSCMPFLRTLQTQHSALHLYELPTLPRGTWMWRRMIDYWMVTGIPDRAVRAATITLYLDVARFIRALEVPDTRAICTLLVDRAGRVYWRAYGPIQTETAQSLATLLADLTQPEKEAHHV